MNLRVYALLAFMALALGGYFAKQNYADKEPEPLCMLVDYFAYERQPGTCDWIGQDGALYRYSPETGKLEPIEN